MRIPRLFTEQPLQEKSLITLDADASKYLTRVLRQQTGSELVLFNGDGNNYGSVLRTVGKNATVEVISARPNPTESPLKITLVQSLAKGAKLDLVIQKATELGASRITPISNERSVLRLDDERVKRKMDHWRNIAISACTQCNRSAIPTIDRPVSFTSYLDTADYDNTLLLHPHTEDNFADVRLDQCRCSILIGPEGGFSDAEFADAIAHGIRPVRCGPRILRTETAGFAAISILQARYGDLR